MGRESLPHLMEESQDRGEILKYKLMERRPPGFITDYWVTNVSVTSLTNTVYVLPGTKSLPRSMVVSTVL